MAKSNYPNKLDTSVEIPVIRDNITEIGSDVLNSLRSAIFSIEKTLGINPQGAAGNTVASRMNNALDDNGNISKEALDRVGLLSGPISNIDVSKVAGISEGKLNLNFPTQLLQDQISIIGNRIALLILSLEELNALLSAHVHPGAKNRHHAKAITVEEAVAEPSGSASVSLEAGTLQEVLEELYSSHINYTGEGVGHENNSHHAGQLFYDNQDTLDIISSSSVQGAIDDIAGLQGQTLRSSILNLNSNGLIRTGTTFDEGEDNDCGTLLMPATEAAWGGPSGSSREVISFLSAPVPASPVGPFDVLTILDSPNSTDNRDYLIESVALLETGGLQSVTVFGGPKFQMNVGVNARISKSIYTTYNENGLNCSARPRYLRSNDPDVQVANPNAATIISSGIRASNIEVAISNILSIEIDGEPYDIDLFNVDVDVQTVDTIVDKINQYSVDHKLNAFAYKVRALKCYELAITHILPNFIEDIKSRTLKITEASAHSAHEALGLGYLIDREIEGLSGNVCHINGKLITSFGNIKKYSPESLALNIGTTDIVTVGVNFLNEEIRAGDLCTIDGSSEKSDDGTYRIHSVESQTLTLDSVGSTFSGNLGDDAAIFIQRCSAPVGELEFEAGSALLLIDVFITDSGDINYKRRAKMLTHLQDTASGFHAMITDMSQGFISDGDTYKLRVGTDGIALLEENLSGEQGEGVYVASTGRYKIFSADKFNYVILDVFANGAPLTSDETIIEGGLEIQGEVMHLSRIVYSSEFGFIMGGPSGNLGIPQLTDKRTTGTVDDTIISENLLERYIQGPRNELRGSGIIRDLGLKAVIDHLDGETCRIDVYPGVGVINGVRVEYLGINDLYYNYSEPTGKNLYIAIDGRGCLLVSPELLVGGVYISPFFNQNVAHIAYVEIDATWVTDPIITDLRLFVDHLDYKVIADITVANDQRFGHFTDIKKAVDYARKFTKMFPKMGTPSITVKEGEYEVGETILVDFDLKFSGAGPQTVIKRGGELVGGVYYWMANSPVFMIGGGEPGNEGSSDDIIYGTSFADFTYKMTPETIKANGTAFLITQSIADSDSPDAFFSFNNIRFAGSDLGASHDTRSATNQPQEMAIYIGPESNNNVVLGNISITNCYFNWFGLGFGPCYINDGNEHRGIIATGNIALNVHGVSGIPSGSNYGVLWVRDITNYVDVTGDGSSLTGIIETGNVSDDQY
jgi:hypothetical protein